MAETNIKENTKKKTVPVEVESELEQTSAIIPRSVDMPQYVTVKNGFYGMLVYVSPRTGETIIWNKFGDEQEMELRELRNAKSSSRAFFENNWFMFDDPWVIDYLGVGRYYKGAIKTDNFDSIFEKSPAELKKFVSALPSGQKSAVLYRASELIASGEIDSRKKIAALEEGLGVELIEK